jgi:hypothetical protein
MNGSRSEFNLNPVSGSRRCASREPMQQTLHRTAEVMQQEAVSLRTMARRMNVSVDQARAETNPQRDLRLSELYRWKSALNVPIVDLLVHPGTGLSDSVELRAKLLKSMKTVRSIQEEAAGEKVSRLAARLAGQLTDLMPELKDVSSWPAVGKRRTLDELGAIVENMLPDSIFGGSPPTNGVSD